MNPNNPQIRETLAPAIQEEYVQHQTKTGKMPLSNPSMVPWDELPEHLKESNRQQADYIGEKLKAVGCEIKRAIAQEKELFEFTPEEIEKMAEMEHERWVEERLRDGWKAGLVKNIEKRISPYLNPMEPVIGRGKGLRPEYGSETACIPRESRFHDLSPEMRGKKLN